MRNGETLTANDGVTHAQISQGYAEGMFITLLRDLHRRGVYTRAIGGGKDCRVGGGGGLEGRAGSRSGGH